MREKEKFQCKNTHTHTHTPVSATGLIRARYNSTLFNCITLLFHTGLQSIPGSNNWGGGGGGAHPRYNPIHNVICIVALLGSKLSNYCLLGQLYIMDPKVEDCLG